MAVSSRELTGAQGRSRELMGARESSRELPNLEHRGDGRLGARASGGRLPLHKVLQQPLGVAEARQHALGVLQRLEGGLTALSLQHSLHPLPLQTCIARGLDCLTPSQT